jgi:ATP-dependent RNA helicase RhlE
MPDAIQKLATTMMSQPTRIAVANNKPTVDGVTHTVCFVRKEQKFKLLVELLQRPNVGRAIVFSKTKHGADRIVRQLQKSGVRCAALHGNKSQNARQRILAGFRADQAGILVATDIAARGIDVEAVTHVINFDLPMEPETYVHRIGRTARAGAAGIAISFCGADEHHLLRDIERLLKSKIPIERDGQEPMPCSGPDASPRKGHATRNSISSRAGVPPRRRKFSGRHA